MLSLKIKKQLTSIPVLIHVKQTHGSTKTLITVLFLFVNSKKLDANVFASVLTAVCIGKLKIMAQKRHWGLVTLSKQLFLPLANVAVDDEYC